MTDTLDVIPWLDPMLDSAGHDPRSWYAETFWLPTLGPTCLLLLRHFADALDRSPEGITVRLVDLAMQLGLGPRAGSASPLQRSLHRLTEFELAHEATDGTLQVRRRLPTAAARHLQRLPAERRAEHAAWQQRELDELAMERARRRARRMAFVLLEEGDDPDHVERLLAHAGLPHLVAADAVQWAAERHRRALHAAEAPPRTPAPAGGTSS